MNLHFKDKELFEKLKKATLHKVVIGSSMYGTNDENSDVDYLYIYVPSISERNSFYPSHHQLQFKEDGIDHNFVNIFSFLKNCINGDSTINFETIHEESIKNSPLKFLYDLRYAFHNYKIIRSYNGLARRDLRELGKQTSDVEKNKKIAHVLRGHEFSKMILGKNFSPLISEELKTEIFRIKKIEDWKDRKETVDYLKDIVEVFRKQISELYDSKTFEFPSFMDVESQNILETYMTFLINSDIWKEKGDWYMNMTPFYEANENVEIRYE